MRTVNLALGDLTLEAFGSLDRNRESLPALVGQAVGYYLADESAGRPAWPYPRFRRDEQPKGGEEVEVSLDDRTWDAVVVAAGSQGVSPEQLLQHAILYFAAEIDSGRVTARILKGLGDEGEEGP